MQYQPKIERSNMRNLRVLLLVVISLIACSSSVTIDSDQVIIALQEAGIEAEAARPLTKDDYGLAPYVCEGQRILLPSICADCGGRIFTCDNQDDLEKLQEYYVSMGETSAMFFSWVFAHEDVLIQLNGDLPEETAAQYETALKSLP